MERGSAPHPPLTISLGGLTTLACRLGEQQVQGQFIQFTKLLPVRRKQRENDPQEISFHRKTQIHLYLKKTEKKENRKVIGFDLFLRFQNVFRWLDA